MNKGYLTFVHISTFHLIPAGFEPATVRLEGECSIQLSYGTKHTSF